jgi:hypothetical protein
MNGHAIVAPDQVAVVCRPKGPCTITSTTGRGDISGSNIGIVMREGKLAVSHVDLHDNTGGGIYTPLLAARMTLTDVTANDNGGIGIRAEDVRASGVTANGNGQSGVEALNKVRGTNVVTSDNGWAGCIAARGVKLAGFTATGNGTAGLSNTGGGIIVAGGPTQLTSATVTGNTFRDGNDPIALDLITTRKPKLTATTCDHSASIVRESNELGPPWGVCAGD